MHELLTALGLILVIEGGAYALFPAAMKRAMLVIQAQSTEYLRLVGFGAATVGVGVICAVDHFGA
ncbi:MAG: DUF2065 domain-containing protein [Alphaproteobacteria bacterium]|jgi:hypothetical protein|nr:DUF2065 domain-containing protein [Alphaproteobacteria bacterium]